VATTERVAQEVKPSNSKGAKNGKGGGADETGGKKGGKKKLIIIAVVALIAIGAGLKFTILAPKAASGPKKVAAPVKGAVQPLTPMTVNLADGHFLQVTISLQLTAAGGKEVDPAEASQAIITEFSNKPVVEVTGLKAREKAKEELVKALEKVYPKKVMDIYYTGFVTQ
jgi:flagellar FliL protein